MCAANHRKGAQLRPPLRSAPMSVPSMSGDTHDQLAYSEDLDDETGKTKNQDVPIQGFLGEFLGHHIRHRLSI